MFPTAFGAEVALSLTVGSSTLVGWFDLYTALRGLLRTCTVDEFKAGWSYVANQGAFLDSRLCCLFLHSKKPPLGTAAFVES